MLTCRFTTSWGGVSRCRDAAWRFGFCRFHYECYRSGEIDARGVISEKITDQERRRAINFHGVRPGSAPAA